MGGILPQVSLEGKVKHTTIKIGTGFQLNVFGRQWEVFAFGLHVGPICWRDEVWKTKKTSFGIYPYAGVMNYDMPVAKLLKTMKRRRKNKNEDDEEDDEEDDDDLKTFVSMGPCKCKKSELELKTCVGVEVEESDDCKAITSKAQCKKPECGW